MEYVMLIEVEKVGGYSATFPDLPGCYTQGETLGELMVMAEDAIETHIGALRDSGEPVPKPRHRTATVLIQDPGRKVG